MIEKTVSEIRINGKKVNNLHSLYWGDTYTTYTVAPPKTLEEYTWAEINEIACSGLAPTKFKVGDTKTVTLTDGQKVTVRIIGFDHDQELYGSKKIAKITFEMVDLLLTTYQMGGNSSKYGFSNSTVKTQMSSGSIYNNIPQEIKNITLYVAKKCISSKYDTNVGSTGATFFILSESEICGTTNAIYASTGVQYEYYKNNNNAQSRIKKSNGVATKYWLRDAAYYTKVSGVSEPVTIINEEGNVSYIDRTYYAGVAVAFCIGKEPDAEKTPLDTPVITLDGNVVSWSAVANASYYSVYTNGTYLINVSNTKINLFDSITEAGTYTVQVKARGTGNYSDSELSNSITYTRANTSFTVTFRRVDTAEFAQGFTISIECGTQSLWFGEYDYDTTMQLTVPSSSTPIKVTFNGISGSSYTNSQYIVGSTIGTKTVGTTKTVTVYASSSDNIIDISYVGIS